MNNIYVRLAKTNIQNNRQLYLPYIISGIVTVMMFYLMMFINNNPGLKSIPGSVNLKTIMALGVGIITIFAYIFIFYTNSFIIKRRKKEIGVYNILGMEKRHIARVLGLETVFVAMLAIAGGILSGIIFSKLILMLLYRMLGFQESVSFYIAKAGIAWAVIVFGVLYMLTLLYNLLQIRLANPIELLHGGNVGEKEPKTKGVMAVAGAACLAVAYYIAITTENPMEVLMKFFLAVVLVIVGTYFLFTAGSIAILKMLRKNKKFYYNKKHFTAVSGMLYRMKQNAAGLASICVLSTMVLVMISMTVSMFAGVDDELKERYPYELSYSVDADKIEEYPDCQEIYQTIADTIAKQGREMTDSSMFSYFQLFMKREGSMFEFIDHDTDFADLSEITFLTRENLLAYDSSLKPADVPEPEAGKIDIYSKNGAGKVYYFDPKNLKLERGSIALASSNFMQRSFGERIAMNSPIQGTAADIIKIAMIRVKQRLEREQLKSKLILQVHDELLIEAAADEEEYVKTLLAEEMRHAADLAVTLEVDVKSGRNWFEAH